MTVVVTHTTPADSTFSSTGAAAWNADHALSGVGTMAEQNANNVAITGGTINNTTIGATTPSTGVFTTLTAQTGRLNGTGNNFVLGSQGIGNSDWNNGVNITVALNSATAPNGTTTATTLTNATDTTFGSGNNTRSSNITVLPNTTYTFSIYLKLGTATTCATMFRDGSTGSTTTVTQTTAGVWTRFSSTVTTGASTTVVNLIVGGANGTFYAWGAQFEFGSTLNTYIPTTTTAVYGTPTLSFSGVSTIGLQSDGSLFVQPAGTGALQAQATTSTAVGGNARGVNAVDWQTYRNTAGQVASNFYTVIGGGSANLCSGFNASIVGGSSNISNNNYTFVGGGLSNTASLGYANIVGGYLNSALGFYNFIGGGFTNSGTSNSAVTTQSATMNGTTAVTLSGSNANIKVGQLIVGTSINNFPNTYVAAISGTSLTLSQVASGSSTSTLSFFTPHGVVVGGGNNQATGSYSFIGGGGDAGTASNRNVASGDWSVVAGGLKSVASGQYAFVGGGSGAIASGAYAVVSGGVNNQATGFGSTSIGGYNNISNSAYSATLGGNFASTRGIEGISVFGSQTPLGGTLALAQSSLLVLAVQTTDATATVLRSNASAASTNNQVILPNNSAYAFKGTVIANVTGGGNTKAWSIEGAIKRGANAASTALVGTPTVTSAYADVGAATWAITATADTTNGGLAITFTGQAGTTIRVVAKLETTEVTF